MAQTVCVMVSAVDRERLEAIVADRNQRQKYAERARIVLASADRGPAQRVAQSIGVSRPTVWRFAEAGVEGLLRDKTRKPGKAPIAADKAAQLVALTPAFAGAGSGPNRRIRRPIGPAVRWPRRWGSRWARCSASGGGTTCSRIACGPSSARATQFCGQAQRHRRPLCRSPGACRGALARREKPRSRRSTAPSPGCRSSPGVARP